MLSWLKSNGQRKNIQEDRKYLEARVRRFLKGYLGADREHKHQYYEIVAGASAACQPEISDSNLEGIQLARRTAEAAIKVVRRRELQATDGKNHLAQLITDAYATVAVANRRAAGAYTIDDKMQKLGTAAVHLNTIATSYMARDSKQAAD